MGGVVSEIGDIGQGIISGVNEGLTDLDDSLPQEAKIAAAIYLASQGIPVEGAALSSAGATEAALTATDLAIGGGSLAGAAPTIGATEAALAATDLAIGGGGGGAVNAGFTLPAIPPEVSAVSNANSVVNAVSGGASAVPTAIPSAVTTAGEMTAQQTLKSKLALLDYLVALLIGLLLVHKTH